MRDDPPRLALVVDPADPDRYPAHDLLAAAVDDGWSAQIVYDRTAPEIPDIVPLLRAVGRRPSAALRTTRPQSAPPGRRLRLSTLLLGPQVLHLPSVRTAAAWTGWARRLGARTLLAVDSDDLSGIAFDGLEMYARAWSTADRFHVESEPLARLLSQHGAQMHRISVIPPPVDQELLRLESRSSNGGQPLRVLSVGPLSSMQGYEHAIQAIRQLEDREIPCEYRIIGRGAHLDAVVFTIHQLGLQDRVQVIEANGSAQVRAHVRWAKVFVQLAVVPCSPKAIMDAQAAGVPVVTTAPPPDSPESVLAVPALDPGALAEALARLNRDESLRRSLVMRGRDRARLTLMPGAQTTRLRELHRALVAGD